jgi:tetratricopeptide (TPR) repeat protein
MAMMKASFERALGFFETGDAQMAEQICRSALEDYPQDAKTRCLLGTTLVRQRRHATAEKHLRQVVDMFPDFPKAHRELGNALFGQGHGAEAIECFRRVTELTPEDSVAHFDLSIALSKLGREAESQAALEKSFSLQPERKELFTAAGHQRAGRFAQAESIYREILSRDPKNVNALRLLGAVAIEMGRYRMAAKLLRSAVRLAPEFFGAWIDLARALMEQDDFEQSRETIERAIRLEPEGAYPRMMLGNLLAKAGRYEDAVGAFKVALEKQPDHGGSLAGLGHALKTIGRQSEAIESYRHSIRTSPAFGEAYWSLANLKTFRFNDDEVAMMEQQVDNENLTEETRVNFNFALGKAYEDRKDHDRAFAYYEHGNSMRRMNENYDPVQTELIHDRIIETLSAEFLAEHAGLGDPDAAPIFIVGLPRSGSTLIEQILSSHSQVEGTHELPDLARVIRTINQAQVAGHSYPEALERYDAAGLAELGRQYMKSTERHRTGLPYFTDKMPNNFASAGLIHLILPNAKIINARRHPLDSCMGSYKQLFFKGQAFTYDLVELGEYYLEYQRMMDHWHAALPDKVLDVHYEDMVDDQETQTRRLLEYCGLPWEEACLTFYETERAVNTASSEQVRQPIYSGSINSWRRFEAHLGPLIEVLEPSLRKLPGDQQPGCLR